MMEKIILILLIFVIKANLGQIAEPTRTVDLWNPFGTTTTRAPGTVRNCGEDFNCKSDV